MRSPAPILVRVALMDHSTRSTSPTPSVQAPQHRQPSALIPVPSAPADYRCASDLLVCDAPDSALPSAGALVLNSPGAVDTIASPHLAMPLSHSDSDRETEELGSHQSSYPPCRPQSHQGIPGVPPRPSTSLVWATMVPAASSLPTMAILGCLAGPETISLTGP